MNLGKLRLNFKTPGILDAIEQHASNLFESDPEEISKEYEDAETFA